MTNDFIEAYQQSIELLYKASTPFGFVASVNNITNYQRIWTRDGVITGLATLLSGESALINTFELTIHTIFKNQHPTGFFPSNVDPLTLKSSYGGNCGRVDNVSWAIIGLMQYIKFTNNDQLAKIYHSHVEKAFAVMNAWEFNGKHLMYVPQSGNWADEFIQHGYVLYDQLLRVWALELAGNYFQNNEWLEKASILREVISINYWNHVTEPSALYSPNLIHQLQKVPDQYWLMGFNPARVYPQFDLAANSLALLLEVGTLDQKKILIDFLDKQLREKAFLLPSFSPTIENDDFLMQELADNYAYEFRNIPHEFHNGGLWPVWNGWMCAAMNHAQQRELADQLLLYLKKANKINTGPETWGFYENFQGTSHTPIGVQYCTWSASGFIIALSYRQGRKLL
jgi:GH15 family glucan-1,4-alpha-glucosidase